MYKPVDNPIATIELSEPIEFMGSSITKIALRKPTGRDILKSGNPLKPAAGGFDVDESKAFLMISTLAGLPILGCLEDMSAPDAVEAIWSVAGLFIRAS